MDQETTVKPMTWEGFVRTRLLRERPLVIAHRGTPKELPENTLASFSRALEQGADVLETDLRFTSDGVIVLFHDATLERTTDGEGLVSEHSVGEIKRLRTRMPSGELVDEHVPTLLELLQVTQANTPLLLELKDKRFLEEAFAQSLVDTLAVYQMLDKCAVVSFSMDLVQAVERICPELPSGLITLNKALPVRNAELLGPAWPLLFVNPLYVACAHRMGSIVAPLDTSPEKRMWYYLLLGVDAVLADRPHEAIKAMQRR